jgi:phage terminase small subunit
MGGRPRLPDAIKELKGTARKDRVLKKPTKKNTRGGVVKPLSRLPPPPDGLGDYGRKQWMLNVRILKESGNWNEAYSMALSMYCEVCELWFNSLAILKRENLLPFEERTNYSMASQPHPTNLIDKYWKMMVQMQDRFGWNPVANVKVPSAAVEEKDPKKEKARAMFGG